MNEQESVSGGASLSSGDASLPRSFTLLASANDILLALTMAETTKFTFANRVRLLSQRKASEGRMLQLVATSNTAGMSAKERDLIKYTLDMFEKERVSMNFMGIDMSKQTMMSFTASILSEDQDW